MLGGSSTMSQLDSRNRNLDDWEEIYQMRFGGIIYIRRRNRPLEPIRTKTGCNIFSSIYLSIIGKSQSIHIIEIVKATIFRELLSISLLES